MLRLLLKLTLQHSTYNLHYTSLKEFFHPIPVRDIHYKYYRRYHSIQSNTLKAEEPQWCTIFQKESKIIFFFF